MNIDMKVQTEHGRPGPASGSPGIELATHYFRQLYLYAYAPQAEVLHHVRTQALEEEAKRLPGILEAWERLQPGREELAKRESGLADTVQIAQIDTEQEARLGSYATDSLFKNTFSTLPVTFGVIEIDKVVAPQRVVNLDYIDRLSATIPGSPNIEHLLEICVSPKRRMDPIQHLEIGPNTHVFSSPNSDIRFLGAFVKKLTDEDLTYAVMGGLPAAAVIAFVGYGGAPVNVLKAGRRLVLNNGFHRVYALRSIGITHIPCVIQHVKNVELEFPPTVAGLPKDYLLSAPRPVLIKDFFEPGLTIELKARERIKTVGIGIALNQYEVPA